MLEPPFESINVTSTRPARARAPRLAHHQDAHPFPSQSSSLVTSRTEMLITDHGHREVTQAGLESLFGPRSVTMEPSTLAMPQREREVLEEKTIQPRRIDGPRRSVRPRSPRPLCTPTSPRR